LREERLLLSEPHNGSSVSASCQERLEIEPQGFFTIHTTHTTTSLCRYGVILF